jgi:predicted nucleotidyltransferase
MYTFQPAYPTAAHASAADAVTAHFAGQPGVAAVLLTCSCARGQASRDSCLDIAVLLQPATTLARRDELAQGWNAVYAGQAVFQTLLQTGRYSHVDLEFHDGRFDAGQHGWTTGPDEFELGIGNLLVYSVPLWQGDDTLAHLQAAWLPYYAESLRQERLAMVRAYCLNNLDHIPLYVDRGLYFQAFRRLHNAFGEFLQALFISRRIYPIAYDKWVREQVEAILGLPELYRQLPRLFEIDHFESDAIARKGEALRQLLKEYVP